MSRLTGGTARGRVLREPVPSGVRPTSARVREALFSIVGQDLSGRRVLDAFGGSGLVGLEAWSRGADVTVYEQSRRALAAIRRNGEAVGATWTVKQGDVLLAARALSPFDGVFADPPYGTSPEAVLGALGPLASDWLVLETDLRDDVPPQAGTLTLDRMREYGGTRLWVYRPGARDAVP